MSFFLFSAGGDKTVRLAVEFPESPGAWEWAAPGWYSALVSVDLQPGVHLGCEYCGRPEVVVSDEMISSEEVASTHPMHRAEMVFGWVDREQHSKRLKLFGCDCDFRP